MECDIRRLNEDEFVLVEIYARLAINTLIDNNIFDADISSIGIAKISALPNAPRYNPPAQLVAVKFFNFNFFFFLQNRNLLILVSNEIVDCKLKRKIFKLK